MGIPMENDEAIFISALSQYAYCPRRCALMYLEGEWEDNEYTLRGTLAHQRVDLPEGMVRNGVRVERALPLWSERLNLVGRADVVEFPEGEPPYPVEYKLGKSGGRLSSEIQLCAEAMCLEEMFAVSIQRGALFQKSSQKRREVQLTATLRQAVEATVYEVRQLLRQQALPPPVADKRCPDCSLIHICMPELPIRLAQLLESSEGQV
jgi:CRISPR-associated exonuclease Cas4